MTKMVDKESTETCDGNEIKVIVVGPALENHGEESECEFTKEMKRIKVKSTNAKIESDTGNNLESYKNDSKEKSERPPSSKGVSDRKSEHRYGSHDIFDSFSSKPSMDDMSIMSSSKFEWVNGMTEESIKTVADAESIIIREKKSFRKRYSKRNTIAEEIIADHDNTNNASSDDDGLHGSSGNWEQALENANKVIAQYEKIHNTEYSKTRTNISQDRLSRKLNEISTKEDTLTKSKPEEFTSEGSTTKLSTPKHSMSEGSTTKLSTPKHSMSEGSTTKLSTPKHSMSEGSTTKLSTPKHSMSEGSTTKLSTPKHSMSEGSTTKLSTPKHSMSEGSTTKLSTPKHSMSEGSTTKLSTPKHSMSEGSTTKLSTPKHSMSEGSTTKLSTPKHSMAEGSTTKLSTPKRSMSEGSLTKLSMPKRSMSEGSTPKFSTPIGSTSKGSTTKPSTPKDCTGEDPTGEGIAGEESPCEGSATDCVETNPCDSETKICSKQESSSDVNNHGESKEIFLNNEKSLEIDQETQCSDKNKSVGLKNTESDVVGSPERTSSSRSKNEQDNENQRLAITTTTTTQSESNDNSNVSKAGTVTAQMLASGIKKEVVTRAVRTLLTENKNNLSQEIKKAIRIQATAAAASAASVLSSGGSIDMAKMAACTLLSDNFREYYDGVKEERKKKQAISAATMASQLSFMAVESGMGQEEFTLQVLGILMKNDEENSNSNNSSIYPKSKSCIITKKIPINPDAMFRREVGKNKSFQISNNDTETETETELEMGKSLFVPSSCSNIQNMQKRNNFSRDVGVVDSYDIYDKKRHGMYNDVSDNYDRIMDEDDSNTRSSSKRVAFENEEEVHYDDDSQYSQSNGDTYRSEQSGYYIKKRTKSNDTGILKATQYTKNCGSFRNENENYNDYHNDNDYEQYTQYTEDSRTSVYSRDSSRVCFEDTPSDVLKRRLQGMAREAKKYDIVMGGIEIVEKVRQEVEMKTSTKYQCGGEQQSVSDTIEISRNNKNNKNVNDDYDDDDDTSIKSGNTINEAVDEITKELNKYKIVREGLTMAKRVNEQGIEIMTKGSQGLFYNLSNFAQDLRSFSCAQNATHLTCIKETDSVPSAFNIIPTTRSIDDHYRKTDHYYDESEQTSSTSSSYDDSRDDYVERRRRVAGRDYSPSPVEVERNRYTMNNNDDGSRSSVPRTVILGS